MTLTIRMSRAGAKKKPTFRIVVADSRRSRDGKFIEKLGYYNPLLPKDSKERVTLYLDRVKYWLSKGAKPSYKVSLFLGNQNIIPMPAKRNNPQKAIPKSKRKKDDQEDSTKTETTPKGDKPETPKAEAAPAKEEQKKGDKPETPKAEAAPAKEEKLKK